MKNATALLLLTLLCSCCAKRTYKYQDPFRDPPAPTKLALPVSFYYLDTAVRP